MRALLLAGGGGSRLWPLSTEETPKQFLALLSDRSLLAETHARLEPLTAEIYVATSQRHAARVRPDLPAGPAPPIPPEPCRRNPGPAVLAAAIAFERDGD